MFWASIVMWALTTAHLGLLIQRLSFAKTTLWEAKAAVSLVTVQVGTTRFLVSTTLDSGN